MQDDLFFHKLIKGLTTISQIKNITYRYNPRELIYQYDKVKLFHYQAQTKQINIPPLLIVFATVNRPEILDLFPERSFIGGLLQNGIDVYLLDWGYPDAKDKNISFDDYINRYLSKHVNVICQRNGVEQINLLGVCQGGVISLCYSILSTTIKNLILISTPIDFHARNNLIREFIKNLDFNSSQENISGAWLTQFFISLRPFELMGKKYLHFLDNIENEEMTNKFLAVEKWLHDAPDQSHQAFHTFINEFYRENKLIKGSLTIADRNINLKQLTIPILNIMAREDEIVPMNASRVLKKYVGSSDYSAQTFASGHIGIYISDKVGNKLARAIANWLRRR